MPDVTGSVINKTGYKAGTTARKGHPSVLPFFQPCIEFSVLEDVHVSGSLDTPANFCYLYSRNSSHTPGQIRVTRPENSRPTLISCGCNTATIKQRVQDV